MKIPKCPNHVKSTSICEESRLRFLHENEHAFVFTCSCCKLIWSVSKPRTKEAARWVNECRKVEQATQKERELSARRLYSFPSKVGV